VGGDEHAAGRRLSIITIDQAIAGASNVLIAVLAARLLGVSSFGLFGIVFLVYVMLQGVARALVCDPLLVHPVEAETRWREIIGTSCLLGAMLGGAVLLIGLLVHIWAHALGSALIVLGAFAPLLVLQDLGRYLAFATQRPARAVVLDVAWLALQLVTVAALFVTDTRTLAWFIAAWAGAGAAAGLLVATQYAAQEIRFGLAWLRHTWSFSWRYLISYTSTQGAALGASGGVGMIAGTAALGGLQGATLLARPFMTIQVAAIAASIGEVTRSTEDEQALRRHAIRTSTLTTAFAVANVAVLLLLPAGVGRAILGDSWKEAHPLLLPMGVQIVFLGIMTGARAALLGMRAIRTIMKLDIVGTVGVLISTVAGSVVDGVSGALWCVAVCQGLLTVACWTLCLGHRPAAARAVDGTPDPPLPLATVAGAPPV
jgi:O-antigen/teichoic acid export membrane protein